MTSVATNKKDIEQAYQDVRDDKTATNFVLLNEDNGNWKVEAKGSTGIQGVKELLKEDQAQFVFLRFVYSNDPLSQRAKFVFISWCGPQVKVMKKAKLTVQIADVKTIFKNFAIEIQTSDIADLNEEAIRTKVQKAAGANYNAQGALNDGK